MSSQLSCSQPAQDSVLRNTTLAMDQLYRLVSGVFAARTLDANENNRPGPSSTSHDEQADPFLEERLDTEMAMFRSASRTAKGKGSALFVLSGPVIAALVVVSLSLGVAISSGIWAHLSASTVFSGNKAPAVRKVMKEPCGNTPAQARARGCHFDVISFCWLPDECYDASLSHSFDQIRTWEWYLDPDKTQPLTHDEIMTGEFTGLYVDWEYHMRHCTAMWKKMHRAILPGALGYGAVDGYIGSYNHTEHCEHMLLNRNIPFENINTRIRVKYPDCGI